MANPGVPFTRLGRYEVLAPIAAGGMASVYLGRSDDDARAVALKVIRPEHARNRDFVAMFLDEAGIAGRLAHPNIVELVEFGHDGAQYFLAMDLVLGQTLARIVEASGKQGTKLPAEVVAWIGARVADGLHHAHEQRDSHGAPLGVVHRDVNPSNVLVSFDGVPKIIDFGLARASSRIASTAAGVVKGKLAYLAPEQTRGETVDRRADVYQLAITLWELTVGKRLFKVEDDVETVRRVMASQVIDPRTLVEGYPPELAVILMRALARDREERTPTADALAKELDDFVAGRVDAARVGAIVGELFPEEGRRSTWEVQARAMATAPPPAPVLEDEAKGRLQAWDDDAKTMTWMHVDPPTEPAPETPLDRASLRALLAARASASGDAVAAARANIELAILGESEGDLALAEGYARAALACDPGCTAAHGILRRVRHRRGAAGDLVEHVDAEIAAATSDGARADLLAERARLIAASGADAGAVLAAWEHALAASEVHPAALKGVEGALVGDDAASARMRAGHLARMAAAYFEQPALAACLHVERAHLLDVRAGDPSAAWGALEQALAIDPGIGPTRAACVRHASVHRDAAMLVALLDDEASAEPDGARAARLELDAACVARLQLADPGRARVLLERAHHRAPTSPIVDRRVLDDLVRLHTRAQRWSEARLAHKARAAFAPSPRARAHESLRLAGLAVLAGDGATAIADLEEARVLDPEMPGALERLDSLLEADPPRREALWVAEASRAGEAPRRAAAWSRAATLAAARGDRGAAIAHLRAAMAIAPDDAMIADRLSALLAPQGPGDPEARSRIAVARHAAERARDADRRVAMLERVAVAWEEVVGDAALAAATYEEVRTIDPARRSALLGLQRCAARLGDPARLARALLDEANVTGDAAEGDALRVRAAEALAPVDGDRALEVAHEVLVRDPANDAARAIAIGIHERAERWGLVDRALAAGVEHARDRAARVATWMRRAEIQRGPMGAPAEALASLLAARAIDPAHPALLEEIVELVALTGDARALRDRMTALARDAASPEERVRLRVRAAELDELVLLDDAAAEAGYAAALAGAEHEPWIADRLARVIARRAHGAEGAARDPATQVPTADARDPEGPSALRALEASARAQRSAPLLASALERQASAFTAAAPVLGALWAYAALVEWTLPESDSLEPYMRVLARAPADRAALDALLRRAWPRARTGERAAREAAGRALSGLLAHAPDQGTRLALRLSLASLLDPGEGAQGEGASDGQADPRVPLAHYRAALQIDPQSPTAAFGTARLAAIAHDTEATFVATCARADLAGGRVRAALLVRAASLLLSSEDPRLGAREARRARAVDLAESALVADPCSVAAAGVLIPLCTEAGWRDRLVSALRGALDRADQRGAIALLGVELARVTAHVPSERLFAIAALERVRTAVPDHVPALFALAEAYAAGRAWPEAVGVLEAAATHARDAVAKKRALVALTLALRSAGLPVDPDAERARREEIASLLAGLADAEPAREAKAALLLELNEARAALGDRGGAEKSLVEAAALIRGPAMLARALAWSSVPADQARVLAAIARRSADLGGPEPAVLGALAQIEIDLLGRAVDGVAHARSALAASPHAHETRAILARGLARAGRHGEAVATVMAMIEPEPAPIASLRDPAASLVVLDASLAADRREAEAVVARELCAVAGGVGDVAIAALTARRLGPPRSVMLDHAALLARVAPPDAPRVLLDVAAAIAGIEVRIFPEDLVDAGVTTRDRVAPGHPLRALFDRLARTFGVEGAELAVGDDVAYARVVSRGEPWVVAPSTLLARPEPVQIASLARALVRVTLGTPWIERLPPSHIRAYLVAAARLASPEWGVELGDRALEDAVAGYSIALGRALGRKQKKALSALAPAIESSMAPRAAAADALVLGVARTEVRAAFLVTGDLLATLEDLRTRSPELAGAMTRSPAALAATLAHSLAGDVARFALTAEAALLRRELGTVKGTPAPGARVQ